MNALMKNSTMMMSRLASRSSNTVRPPVVATAASSLLSSSAVASAAFVPPPIPPRPSFPWNAPPPSTATLPFSTSTFSSSTGLLRYGYANPQTISVFARQSRDSRFNVFLTPTSIAPLTSTPTSAPPPCVHPAFKRHFAATVLEELKEHFRKKKRAAIKRRDRQRRRFLQLRNRFRVLIHRARIEMQEKRARRILQQQVLPQLVSVGVERMELTRIYSRQYDSIVARIVER